MDTRDGPGEAVSIPPESIEVGRCYLTKTGRVRRVLCLMPDGRVQYEQRRGPVREGHAWPRRSMSPIRTFAYNAEREVPCDWTPDREG